MDDTYSSSGITLVIRLIRSFEHRIIKPLVLKDVSLEMTTDQLMKLITRGELCFSIIFP